MKPPPMAAALQVQLAPVPHHEGIEAPFEGPIPVPSAASFLVAQWVGSSLWVASDSGITPGKDLSKTISHIREDDDGLAPALPNEPILPTVEEARYRSSSVNYPTDPRPQDRVESNTVPWCYSKTPGLRRKSKRNL